MGLSLSTPIFNFLANNCECEEEGNSRNTQSHASQTFQEQVFVILSALNGAVVKIVDISANSVANASKGSADCFFHFGSTPCFFLSVL